jgi:serine/threonine protein phosphatase 1
MPQGRTIAVGDIHGCSIASRNLIAMLELSADDTLVMLGDAIDRGTDSKGVIEQLLTLKEQCQLVPILGNHEQMLLDAVDNRMPLQDWLIHGGAETLDSYSKDAALNAIPEEHLDFIRSWGDYYETASHFFAHGNYLPRRPLDGQPWETMRWRSLKYFLPKPHVSGKTAVVGHTSNKQGKTVNLGHLVCIDTFCHGGGWLTAYEPDSGRLWQSSEAGEVQEGELPLAR